MSFFFPLGEVCLKVIESPYNNLIAQVLLKPRLLIILY